MKNAILTLWIVLISAQYACIQGIGSGQRFELTASLGLASGQFAQVFIPDYYHASVDDKFTLVFHLHAASWVAEDAVYKSRANAILFNIHLGALSSPYQAHFQDVTRFPYILETILSVLKSNNILPNPQLDTLIITSFSAGYAGVREILKVQQYYDSIDALILADGLHCSSDPAAKEEQMMDFLRYARDARDRKKIMRLTHSSIVTSGYESTTATADYLTNGIGAARQLVSTIDEIGLQTSACDTGNFHLRGYAGDTADDHMKHLYAMYRMLAQAFDDSI